MKVLITGVKGFIGNKIFSSLKESYEIIGIDIASEENGKGYCFADISDYSQLERFFKKNADIDVMIHAAALAHRKGSNLSFRSFEKINFEGTKNLIDLSNKHLKLTRFIFFSSISVYGEQLKKAIYSENDVLKPKTPYAVTKKMSEDYIRKHCQCDYTITRFVPVYSGDFTLNIDRRTLIRDRLYKVGKANNTLSLLNVKNIVMLIEYLLKHKNRGVNEVYNVADSRTYTFQDLLEIQKQRYKLKKIISFPKLIFYGAYGIGKILNSNFLVENSIKLLSNNVFDTSKISAIIPLTFDLREAYG